jgi:hypothetical protein
LRDIPYKLAYGQPPRVGISGLLVSPQLLDILSTEEDLNTVCQYNGIIDLDNLDGEEVGVDDPIVNQSEANEEVVNHLNDAERYMLMDENADIFGANKTDPTTPVVDNDEAPALCLPVSDNSPAQANATILPVSDNSIVQATASLLADGKEEGDVDTTYWEDMISELPRVIDVAYLRLLKDHAVVPIVYCVDTKNINNMHSFVPVVMKRIGNAWEMLDDKEDELYDMIPWSGDNGITNNWGLYLRHPDKEWCSYFKRD